MQDCEKSNVSETDSDDDEIDFDKQMYEKCIQKQLDEINMLTSIFCNPGETHIHDPSVICNFNDFIQKKTDLRVQLDFSVFITFEENKIELFVSVPHTYPALEYPNVRLRSQMGIKFNETRFKEKLEQFINTLDKEEPYIYQLIIWIQENLDEFKENDGKTLNSTTSKEESAEFERLWILSHHIKNKIKRREILKQAHDLNLTGFCRPGKPGVICVEGAKCDTQEFWHIIKSMHWQKISVKKSETKIKTNLDIEKCRKFVDFKEQIFTDVGDQMDMGLFMQFLDQNKCSYIKSELFGF